MQTIHEDVRLEEQLNSARGRDASSCQEDDEAHVLKPLNKKLSISTKDSNVNDDKDPNSGSSSQHFDQSTQQSFLEDAKAEYFSDTSASEDQFYSDSSASEQVR